MKKSAIIGLILLASLLILPAVSAEIFVGQPGAIYNVGDEFSINVSISENADTSGFFSSSLICNNAETNSSSVEIYRVPLNVKAGVSKSMVVSGTFDKFLIGNLLGNCFISASFGGDESTSQQFEISNEVAVILEVDKYLVNPGETVKISGRAAKKNGQFFNGFIEISIPEIGVSYSDSVYSGRFNFSFVIPQDAKSGNYKINGRVYEGDANDVKNEGTAKADVKVNQITKGADIAVSEQQIVPGNDLIYSVSLYDQAGERVIGQEGKIIVYTPEEKVFLEELARVDETSNLSIGTNYTPGYWRIEAKFGNIATDRQILVENLEKVSFSLLDKMLTITNIGNVPYKKSVEISVGDEKQIVDLNLKLGESKKFVLSAPDGNYEIKVSEDGNESVIGSSFLTGDSIRVTEAGTGGFWSKSTVGIWFVLIAVMGAVLIYYFEKVSKRSYLGKVPSSAMVPIALSRAENKGGNIIDEGAREECLIVALKIKNIGEIDKTRDAEAIDSIERAMNIARERGAKVYSDDKGYRTMVFSPTLTGEADNYMRSVRVAKDVESVLLEHNNKYTLKIKFGIGAHAGEMIAGMQGNTRKFVPIGNTLSSAKDIADKALQEACISEKVHRKLAGKMRGNKVEGYNFWKINRIIDREQHSEFISRFMSKL